MSEKVTIACDYKECFRYIEKGVHEGTWITLQIGNAFNLPNMFKQTKHFCSYYHVVAYCKDNTDCTGVGL